MAVVEYLTVHSHYVCFLGFISVAIAQATSAGVFSNA